MYFDSSIAKKLLSEYRAQLRIWLTTSWMLYTDLAIGGDCHSPARVQFFRMVHEWWYYRPLSAAQTFGRWCLELPFLVLISGPCLAIALAKIILWLGFSPIAIAFSLLCAIRYKRATA